MVFFRQSRAIFLYFLFILLFKPSFLEAGDLSFRVEQSKIRLIIPARGAQTINYVVRMPADAQGGHYAVMFLETSLLRDVGYPMEAETKELSVGTTLHIRLGVLFYLEAQNTVKRQASLSNLSVAKDSEGKSLLFACDFKNTGNADITTKPTFDIIDQAGMVYARGEFNEIYTFPQDEAKLTAAWKKPLAKGKYDLILTLDLGQVLKEARLGRGPVLTKEAEIVIGANNEVVKVGELR